MRMTQKEAMAETTRQLGNARNTLKTSKNKAVLTATANKIDYFTAVKAALRGPTREMVKRMRGVWIPAESDFDDDDTLFDVDDWCDWQCSTCHSEICYDDPMERSWLPKFCPNCGAPMTDEAVDMMLERWKEAVDGE